mmetsp:Transcript_33059/g.93564  ORF Transcript_33059/g.93564 Transcript_33059/m.93564 type:complete len:126 (+) Transcript_33059:1047-1424(+)
MGTYSSLDGIGKDSKPPYKYVPLNCTDIEVKSLHVFDEELHCSFGLASRSGWARVNDTGSPTLDSSGWWSGEALSRRRCMTSPWYQAKSQCCRDTCLESCGPSGTALTSSAFTEQLTASSATVCR